ncbi:transposase [Microvirga sp. BT688]|nr:transposase [Microvirga sp.]
MQYRRNFTNRRSGVTKDGVRFYRARQSDCQRCDLKSLCCPNTPRRRIPRDVARALAGTPAFERSRHSRKKIEMLFAHLKRILRLARLRLRGPNGARDEFLLAATAQNLRRLAKLRPMPTFAGVGA